VFGSDRHLERWAARSRASERLVPVRTRGDELACATVLAFAVPRLVVPLYILASAIASSRVYVGVHYPLDVLGGRC
jgi:hypothetical protein